MRIEIKASRMALVQPKEPGISSLIPTKETKDGNVVVFK